VHRIIRTQLGFYSCPHPLPGLQSGVGGVGSEELVAIVLQVTQSPGEVVEHI
jgi:hypothetical protein